MVTLTQEEKQLLRTASKMRAIVKADIEKVANPAILALIRALGPSLMRLGPQLVEMVRTIPTGAWGQIAQNLMKMMSQAAEGARSASIHDDSKKLVAVVASILTKAKIEAPQEHAEKIVLATAVAAAEHRKMYNTELVDALELVRQAQAEIELLKEFI